MAASSSRLQEKNIAENVVSGDVGLDGAEEQLNKQIIQAGEGLLELAYTNEELLKELDRLENLLIKVGIKSDPKNFLKMVLRPARKALLRLLDHVEMDVKISAISCLTEIMVITAPNEPLKDNDMKKYFRLAVLTFGNLSCMTGHGYTKTVSILHRFARWQLSVLMWDYELDELFVGLFQKFLTNTMQFTHQPAILSSMEKIMNDAIDQSDDISLSLDLLHILLASVKKENLHVSPSSYKLGKRILRNGASKLKSYLQKAATCTGFSFGDYANIVASICRGETAEEKQKGAEDHKAATSGLGEAGRSSPSKLLPNKETEHAVAHSSKTLRYFDKTNQQTSLYVPKEASKDIPFVKKRDRKPNPRLKVEEGYDFSWLPVETSHSRKSRPAKKVAGK